MFIKRRKNDLKNRGDFKSGVYDCQGENYKI